MPQAEFTSAEDVLSPKGTRTARRAVREVQIPCDAMESQGIEFAQHGLPLFPEHFS
ncbi:hypothetical protein IB211_00333c [Intestinimonas butyriciproducens]|uniref:Uncharacterized protein n=1 Tax=Intestinimonas butyriciproducens TaxID=1297617 RepID=A0A0S2W079_9FIRM|nr:hypothetical protein IB211_00333c [Intestinimonas butyriciproducens]